MHQKPDADAMGSALGLGHFFEKDGTRSDRNFSNQLGRLAQLDARM